MTEHLPVGICDASVIISLAREQLRFAPASPNKEPDLILFPHADDRTLPQHGSYYRQHPLRTSQQVVAGSLSPARSGGRRVL